MDRKCARALPRIASWKRQREVHQDVSSQPRMPGAPNITEAPDCRCRPILLFDRRHPSVPTRARDGRLHRVGAAISLSNKQTIKRRPRKTFKKRTDAYPAKAPGRIITASSFEFHPRAAHRAVVNGPKLVPKLRFPEPHPKAPLSRKTRPPRSAASFFFRPAFASLDPARRLRSRARYRQKPRQILFSDRQLNRLLPCRHYHRLSSRDLKRSA